ncbi:MAG: UDP-N-acetylmuramate dehydrogenase [Nitrospiraceae bacterium]|nr:UDP-N-acetylmuramate dehydrogenase [Nitrospiraceae bacterium]
MTAQTELSGVFDRVSHRLNEPLARHTYLKIGGLANVALFPSESDLEFVISELHRISMPWIVLGRGSNVVIDDAGFSGAVIFTDNLSECIEPEEGSGLVRCGAGMGLGRLLSLCAQKGLSGMEGLAGIPGTVGGAVYGNSGSFGCEIKDVVAEVGLVNSSGGTEILQNSKIPFRYRSSGISEGSIIKSVLVRLKPDDQYAVKERINGFVRQKKNTQPINLASAGCVFRNPESASAGRLIDDAGCKGMRVGGIEVSRLHANFFVNTGGGSAADYIGLMDAVKNRVMQHSGMELHPEVRIIKRETGA